MQVYCFYTSASTGSIECDNVGPFIMTGFRYFISGKAFYLNQGTSSISNFGYTSILPVVYSSTGTLLSSVTLYTPLTPNSPAIALRSSPNFLDNNAGGYHDTNTFKIGNTQVISMPDDGTLSSLGNAMSGFFFGTNNTVGVVPDMGYNQQLVFLLKTPSAQVSGATDYYTMNLLYNNKVIGY
jgi:hypothetical protein